MGRGSLTSWALHGHGGRIAKGPSGVRFAGFDKPANAGVWIASGPSGVRFAGFDKPANAGVWIPPLLGGSSDRIGCGKIPLDAPGGVKHRIPKN